MGKIVFITGSTGFIGSHLLVKLLEKPNIDKIYLLCRMTHPTSHNKGIQKLRQAFETFHLPTLNINHKINIFAGDISQPNLGLSQNDYTTICYQADIIYHLAATVNHVKPYKNLEAANVNSVEECIKIANIGKQKIINYASTLGAAVKTDQNNMFVEDYPDKTTCTSNMGYLQTKYKAEKALAACKNQNFSNIFRLGYISGNSKNGVSLHSNNQLMLFIKSCIQLRYAPQIERLLNFTPVDFAVNIMTCPDFMRPGNQVINLVNCTQYISWNKLIAYINIHQHKVEQIKLEEWQKILLAHGRSNALFRLILLYRSKNAENKILQFGKKILSFKTEKITAYAHKYNITMPIINSGYLNMIFDYLDTTGFIRQLTQ